MVELHQFRDDSFFPFTADTFTHTGSKTMVHEDSFELLNSLTHSIRLTEHVNARLTIFDQLANNIEVSLESVESVEHLLFVSTHHHIHMPSLSSRSGDKSLPFVL